MREGDYDEFTVMPDAVAPGTKQIGGDHYLKAIQPWDIIREWELNFWEGNIQKYLLRHRFKNRKEDLEKARHYLDYLIENYDALY